LVVVMVVTTGSKLRPRLSETETHVEEEEEEEERKNEKSAGNGYYTQNTAQGKQQKNHNTEEPQAQKETYVRPAHLRNVQASPHRRFWHREIIAATAIHGREFR